MRGRQLDTQLLLLTLRQLRGDELFRAPQHERPKPRAQSLQTALAIRPALFVLGHFALLDRLDVLFAEPARRCEQPRAGERQDRPELGERVLERRSGDREHHVGPQRLDGTVQPRARVLDELRLVEHDDRPVDGRERLVVEPQHRVRRDDDVGIDRERPALRRRRAAHGDVEPGGEPRRLVVPGAQHRRGRHDEDGATFAGLARVEQQRQHLQGLAEPHVVGEHAAEPVPPPEGEAVEALLLVGAQPRVEAGGRWRRDEVAGGAQLAGGGPPRHRRQRLVGEVFEVFPQRQLIAADAGAGLPFGELRRLIEQRAQPVEARVREREVAAVGEQQLLAAQRQGGEERSERDAAPVDLDEKAQIEPIVIVGLDRLHGDARVAEKFAVFATSPARVDPHPRRLLESGEHVGDELGGIHSAERGLAGELELGRTPPRLPDGGAQQGLVVVAVDVRRPRCPRRPVAQPLQAVVEGVVLVEDHADHEGGGVGLGQHEVGRGEHRAAASQARVGLTRECRRLGLRHFDRAAGIEQRAYSFTERRRREGETDASAFGRGQVEPVLTDRPHRRRVDDRTVDRELG